MCALRWCLFFGNIIVKQVNPASHAIMSVGGIQPFWCAQTSFPGYSILLNDNNVRVVALSYLCSGSPDSRYNRLYTHPCCPRSCQTGGHFSSMILKDVFGGGEEGSEVIFSTFALTRHRHPKQQQKLVCSPISSIGHIIKKSQGFCGIL